MRKATAFVAVMAWAIFAIAITPPLFFADDNHEVLAANFGGAVVSTEVDKAVANAAPVQETMKPKDSVIVIDNSAPIKNGVTVPMINYGENMKVVLGRGQNLSYIAWKYTGDFSNWCVIAQASGFICDESIMRRLLVGAVIVIPQELLKPGLMPSPPAVVVNVLQSAVDIAEKDLGKLQKELNDANRWLWFWWGVCALLVIAVLLVIWAGVGARKLHERKYKDHKELEQECLQLVVRYQEMSKRIPGGLIDFQTREGKILQATITKVELVKNDRASMDDVSGSLFGKPTVTEVECPECETRVGPKKFLHHYFEQHPKTVVTVECLGQSGAEAKGT